MNRNQFLSLASKLSKIAIAMDADAKRVRVSAYPGSELAEMFREEAERLRERAERFRQIAEIIEKKFG